MTIETKIAQSAQEAVEILNSLNFRQVSFEFHGENYSDDYEIAYRHFDGIDADGNGTCFGLIEIVINGKLDTVRFINTYRETAVDIKIGNADYTVDDKGAVELIDEPETPVTIETKIVRFEAGKTYAAKKSKLFDSQFTMTVIKRTECYVHFQFDDGELDETICKRKVVCEHGVEKVYYHETKALDGDYEFSAKDVVEPEINADVDDYAVTLDAQDAAVNAEIQNAGTVAEIGISDVYEANKTYTLTIDVTNNKEYWGTDTLVRHFDTCYDLHHHAKNFIFTNSWKLERGDKTIATGDGIKAFHRFITCEIDVSERIAEIADFSGKLEICGERVYFQKGKFVWVMSPKYHASFHAEAGFDGNEHYEILTADKNGRFTCGNLVTEEEFFNVMMERGGCTIEIEQAAEIDAGEYAISEEAQDAAVEAEIQNANTVAENETSEIKIKIAEYNVGRKKVEENNARLDALEQEFMQAQKTHCPDFDWDAKRAEHSALNAETLEILKQMSRIWFAFKEQGYAELLDEPDTATEIDAGEYAISEEAQDAAVEAETKLAKNQIQTEIREIKPEFKRYGSFKTKASVIDATLQAKTFKPAPSLEDSIFAQGKIEVGSHAEAMALIENVTNDRFEFRFEHKENYTDENGKPAEYLFREFLNVRNMEQGYGHFTFREHFTNGEFTHVDLQRLAIKSQVLKAGT